MSIPRRPTDSTTDGSRVARGYDAAVHAGNEEDDMDSGGEGLEPTFDVGEEEEVLADGEPEEPARADPRNPVADSDMEGEELADLPRTTIEAQAERALSSRTRDVHAGTAVPRLGEGEGEDVGVAHLSREELYDRARALGIPGRSSMTKLQLADAVRTAIAH